MASAMDEGVIKYECTWLEGPPLLHNALAQLMEWRQRCFAAKLIGVYEEVGIGYGNISVRYGEGFIISGTQTGEIPVLDENGYTEVIEADIEGNRLVCRGPIAASSESLTHAMLYRLSESINAVVHVHSKEMWNRLLNVVPTTGADVPYGTPEMAAEIERLWHESNLQTGKILAMAGHEDGIIAFGENLDVAGEGIMNVEL